MTRVSDNRMNSLRVVGLLAILLLAQGAVAESSELPPDPSRLEADWWNYFVASPEDDAELLAQHFAIATERLTALSAQFSLDDQPRLVLLADAVIANLARYQKFSAEPLPVPPLAKTAQNNYTLPEIRELIEALRKAGVQHAEETQELALLQKAITAGQRDLSQQKVDYRSLGLSSPDRTRKGLLLMQARLQLELAKLELAWRRAGNKVLAERIDNLKSLVEIAAQRLSANDAAIQDAINRRAEAEAKAGQLRQELLQEQLAQSGNIARTPLEQARDRLSRQRLVNLDVRATLEEIVAAQSLSQQG